MKYSSIEKMEMLKKNATEGKESREAVNKYELAKLEKIILKLGKDYDSAIYFPSTDERAFRLKLY